MMNEIKLSRQSLISLHCGYFRIYVFLCYFAITSFMTCRVCGTPSGQDLPNTFSGSCRSYPAQLQYDASIFYPKDSIVGIFYNEYYWEVKIRHGTRYPYFHMLPVQTRNYFATCSALSCGALNTQGCLIPCGAYAPYIQTAHFLDGRVWILFDPTNNKNHYLYEFNYDPPGGTLQFVDKYRPETRLSMFDKSKFSNPGLSATFVTRDPRDEKQRKKLLWTNQYLEDGSLQVWEMDSITQGGKAAFTYNLRAADGKTKSARLIWAMDTFAEEGNSDLVLSYRRFAGELTKKDTTYALQYRLTLRDDVLFFDRISDRIWDVGLLIGCPQSFCFDATIDGTVVQVDEGNQQNKYMVLLMRGPYVFKVTHGGSPHRIPYPRVPQDVFSLRDVISNKQDYLADGFTMIDTSIAVQSEDGSYQTVYLIKGNTYFIYTADKHTPFYDTSHGTGKVSDLGLSMATSRILDATWHNPAEKRLVVFSGRESWSCGVQHPPQRGEKHTFVGCSSLGSAKPKGWRAYVDSSIRYPDHDITVFTRAAVSWSARHEGWSQATAEPALVHPLNDNTRALFYDPSGVVCDYKEHASAGTTKEKVWAFLQNFLSEEAGEVIGSLGKAKESNSSSNRGLWWWLLLLVAAIAALAATVYYYRRQKEDDFQQVSMALQSRATYRSRLSRVGGSTAGPSQTGQFPSMRSGLGGGLSKVGTARSTLGSQQASMRSSLKPQSSAGLGGGASMRSTLQSHPSLAGGGGSTPPPAFSGGSSPTGSIKSQRSSLGKRFSTGSRSGSKSGLKSFKSKSGGSHHSSKSGMKSHGGGSKAGGSKPPSNAGGSKPASAQLL